MPDKQLLNDKLVEAKLPQICVPRKRLSAIFDRESEKRVIFVTAPAGYGKTVSVRLWLSDSGRVVVWIGLDAYDNTPSIFYKLFCTAMMSAQPGNKMMAEIFASPSFASSPIEHTIRFLSEFKPDGKKYAVVLDDTHLVQNKELLKSGMLVRKRLPLSFLTLVLTRNEISGDYTSTMNEGDFAVISSGDLVFSPDEIRGFYTMHGRSITDDEVAEAYAVTGGWVIGVNALVLGGKPETKLNSKDILENYIKSRIWDNWDYSFKLFLLKTAVADELPTGLCDRLCECGSRETLENLCCLSPFVSRIADDTYSYHNLFLEFLRTQLQTGEYPVDIKALNGIAAGYYAELGEYFTARAFAVRSGDPELLANVIHSLSQYRSASLGEFADYARTRRDEGETEKLCECAPFLYASLMWERYLLGDAAKMEYYMDKLYGFLPEIAGKYPREAENIMMRISLDYRVSTTRFTEIFQVFSNGLSHEIPQNATLTHEMPFVHRSSRDFSELADKSVMEQFKASFAPLLKENFGIFAAAIESGILFEKNMLKEALAAALEANSLIRENSSISGELRFCAYIHLYAVYYTMNNPARNDVMKKLEQLAEREDSREIRQNFLAYKTRLRLFDGNKYAAKEWLENYFVTDTNNDSGGLEFYKIYQHFTTARAYIVLGMANEASRFISGLRRLASDFRRPLDAAEAGVLQAVLEWAVGNKAEAQNTLETVLDGLQHGGFIRVVSAEGAAVLPVLRRLDAKVRKDGYSGPLQSQYTHQVMLAAYEQSKRRRGIAVHIKSGAAKLSKRQKLIISLLADGCKYTEITEATGLSIHTVKSHVQAAYTKLCVNNSLDAVAKARELGFID